MQSDPSRMITVVVAHPSSAEQLVLGWRTLLNEMRQNPIVRPAHNVSCLSNMALHGGTSGSEADLVVLAGHYADPVAWKLPRGEVVKNANALQSYLRSSGFRKNIVVISDDLSAFCKDHFDGLWRIGRFTASPLAFAGEVRKLFGLND